MKLPAKGLAADFRAQLGDVKVRLPLRHDETAPGYVVDAEGKRIAAVNAKGLDLEAHQAIALARYLAGALNWFAGMEIKT